MAKKQSAAEPLVEPMPTPTTGIAARKYLKTLEGQSMSQIAREAGVPASTLRSYMRAPSAKMDRTNALKLEKWSGGRISAARTVGL